MRYTVYFLRRHPLALMGLVIIAVDLFLVVAGPYIVPYNPRMASFADALQPPSFHHLFGTDETGMDVLSRVIAATRLDVTIAVVAVLLSFVIGVPLGVLAGLYGEKRGIASIGSAIVMRIMDIIQSFPVFIFALALVSMSGTSAKNVILAVAFVNMPVFVRLLRAEALWMRERPFVDAARCAGNREIVLAFRHLLPNSLTAALTQASVVAGWAIILTAGLSFVGAGVPRPTPEWGLMISDGAKNMVTGQWWPALFPGLALALTVLGFAGLGNAIQVLMDPKARG